MVEGAALRVVGSEVVAHSRGIGPEDPGLTEKWEARPGAGGGATVSGAVCMVSESPLGAGARGWAGCGGAGRSVQSLLRSEWGSPQFGHLAGAAGHQSRTGLRIPPLGQEGLGHLCSAFVWLSEQKGQVGASSLHQCLTCPNFQHFSHWV